MYTTDIKALELLSSYLYTISKWNLSPQEAATLYLLVSTSYQRLGATEEEQHFLIKYLSTFENVTTPEAMAVATHAARSAAINYIKSPAGSQKYHVPRLRAVRALATHTQYGRLYELVDIFAHKDLNAFLQWCNTNPDNITYLNEQGINKEKSIETMRLLTLCTLSSSDKVLSYEVIANALQVSI